MTARAARGWLVSLGAVLACAGCGFKGPLYLPGRNAAVVTRPAPAAPSATLTSAAQKKSKTPQAPQPQPPAQ